MGKYADAYRPFQSRPFRHTSVYGQDRVYECRYVSYTSGEVVWHIIFFGKKSDHCQAVPICEIVGKCGLRDKQIDELERVDGQRSYNKERTGLCFGDIIF